MDTQGILNAVFDPTTLALCVSGVGMRVAGTETVVTVVNTVTETNLASLTIPANTSQQGDMYLFMAGGTQFNDSGSSVNYTHRFKVGGTNILVTNANAYTTAATRRKWRVEVRLVVRAADIAVTGHLGLGLQGTATQWLVDSGNTLYAENLSTAPLTSDQALVLSVEMGTAHASADAVLDYAELIRLR